MADQDFNDHDPVETERTLREIAKSQRETAAQLDRLAEFSADKAEENAIPPFEIPPPEAPQGSFIVGAAPPADILPELSLPPIDVQIGGDDALPEPPALPDIGVPDFPDAGPDPGSEQTAHPLPINMLLPDIELPPEPEQHDPIVDEPADEFVDIPRDAPLNQPPPLPKLPPVAPPAPPEHVAPTTNDVDQVLNREGELNVIRDLEAFAATSREYRATLYDILRRIVADLQADHALLQNILRHFEMSRRTPV